MEKIHDKDVNPDQLSPLALAFVGDTVFDLYIRELLVCGEKRRAGELHNSAVKCVKAKAQSDLVHTLLPMLTEKELSVFKRGRNAHTNHIPRSASQREYHNATGLESLIGWLYLSGQIQRIRELLSVVSTE